MRHVMLGTLRATLVDHLPAGQKPTRAVVLCHGFGAPGDDLVPLAEALFARAPALKATTVFAFPEAPIDLVEYGNGARAWWRIDVSTFDRIARGGAEPVIRVAPPGMAEARRAFRGMLDALLAQTGLSIGHVVLGGFSQGAMLATDTALRLDEAAAGLIVLSGAPVNYDEWQRLAPRRKGLPVVVTHGTADQILPLVGAAHLEAGLRAAGLVVDFVTFPGGHAIPAKALDAASALLSSVL